MEEQIKQIISKQLGIKLDSISNDQDLINDLKADSLDTVELMMTIEEKFGIDFDEEDVSSLSTVQSVIDFVTRLSV
jgi:acyl carrier protein